MKARFVKRTRALRRVRRVRKKIDGTSERPRLAIQRTLRNIGAQIIDDSTGRTLCAVSTLSKDLRESVSYGGNAKAAAVIGKAIGERAKELGIEAVCFDRRGHQYHGRVKALADAAREAGLKF